MLVTPTQDWQPPVELPDLRRIGIIPVDTKTKDPGLHADRGSAWPWHGGHVCGISVAYHADGEIRAQYFPLQHPDSENFARENVADLIAAGVKFGTVMWGLRQATIEGGIDPHPAPSFMGG